MWEVLVAADCILIFKQNSEYKLELLHPEERYPDGKEYNDFVCQPGEVHSSSGENWKNRRLPLLYSSS